MRTAALLILSAVAAAWVAMATVGDGRSGFQPPGRRFTVVIENRRQDVIRIKRIGDGPDEHAFEDLRPGEQKTFNLTLSSGQVFAAWERSELVGSHGLDLATIRDPNTVGIGLAADQSGLVPQLMVR